MIEFNNLNQEDPFTLFKKQYEQALKSGQIAIEAISNDLPVIVSAHTGMADFDGESGLRVLPPLHSAVSVADAAIEILQGRIGLPENDFKQIFSFEKFCTSLDGLYKGLL